MQITYRDLGTVEMFARNLLYPLNCRLSWPQSQSGHSGEDNHLVCKCAFSVYLFQSL